ncbi:MAG: DEAD/DEAH box helicase, partial [Gemmatimonadales bacterium]
MIQEAFRRRMQASDLRRSLPREGKLPIGSLPGGARAAFASSLLELDTPAIVVVAATPGEAEAVHADLEFLLGPSGSRYFPQRETLPYEDTDPHVEIAGQRIDALAAMLGGRARLLVTTARGLVERSPIPSRAEGFSIQLRVGGETTLDQLAARLARSGFDRAHTVQELGEFAVRGGIVDVFPFGSDLPVRIELWGDEVASLRTFDLLSQRSVVEVEEVEILPVDLEREQGDAPQERLALLELLPPSSVLLELSPDDTADRVQRLWEETVSGRAAADTDALDPEALVLPPDEASDRLRGFVRIGVGRISTDQPASDDAAKIFTFFRVAPPPAIERDMGRLVETVERCRRESERVLILCDNDGQLERLEQILEERAGRETATYPTLAIGSLSGGFRLDGDRRVDGPLLVLTDHEIFRRSRWLRRRSRYRGVATLESIASIKPGDYVVHLDHGIGRLKRKTIEQIQRMAAELLELYAHRTVVSGHAFPPETSWQREMESAFLYEETPDQLRAWEAVRRDMEEPRPMERLVCGDVGFGKTEIAMRAAFKAVQDGKQVAVLAPTTVLSEQHLHTFRERFAGFPVRVEALTRFRSRTEQRDVLAGIESGGVDVVVGTHRLLSSDVRFHDMGLLVVDEEQRFGVRHKERLKELKRSIDVLTMTATPIPRTLQMSMGKLRDLSLIETPPRDRMPIITHVLPWHDGIILEAMRRELDRGGQVFFVHNRVETIEVLAERVRGLVPDALVAVAHGQMPERDLESAMQALMDGHLDVLVCTSIIENGLDVPNANTMIVHQADRFGLAQLYQLRGRVGRSHHRAYCYLLVPSNVAPDAERRLRVLEHHTELGSGYRVALRDLQLRGAGNLQGTDQSGFAQAVGLDVYQRLLQGTVRRLKGEGDPERAATTRIAVEGEAYLPDDYILDAEQKMHLYRRISRIEERADVDELESELRDRFGPLPEAALRLLGSIRLKLLA